MAKQKKAAKQHKAVETVAQMIIRIGAPLMAKIIATLIVVAGLRNPRDARKQAVRLSDDRLANYAAKLIVKVAREANVRDVPHVNVDALIDAGVVAGINAALFTIRGAVVCSIDADKAFAASTKTARENMTVEKTRLQILAGKATGLINAAKLGDTSDIDEILS